MLPAGRGSGNVLGTIKPPVPTGPKADRPLDPAVDLNREYRYKTKRGGKTFTMSYSGGPPVRVALPLGRDSIPNDVRATMVGSTIRVGPAAPSKPNSERSERSVPRQAPQL